MTLSSRFLVAALGSLMLTAGLRAAEVTSATPAVTNSAAATSGSAAANSAGTAILRDFFAEPDAGQRAALAAKFAAVAPKSWDDLRAMLHRAAVYGDLKPGRPTFQTKGEGVVPAINYVLRVPANYKSDGGAGWPLVIACHAMGGTGEGFVGFVENLLGPDVENYLVACPDSPDGGDFHATRVVEEYPLAVLDDVRRRANVDSNQTILMGYSKGGYTVWLTALFSPGEWAGVVPMSGFPLNQAASAGATIYLPNVLDLSIQSHWGEKDILAGQTQGTNTFNRDVVAEMKRLGAKKYEGLEYPGEGHGLTLKTAKVRAFVAAARRNPFPEQGHLIFHAAWQGRAWYVRVVAAARPDFDFSKQVKVSISSPEELPQAVRAYFSKAAFDLQVRLRAVDNTISVMEKDLQEMEIELPAEKLDWTKPMRVLVNSRPIFAGKRAPDYAELLETARRTYDFERLVAGRVKWAAGQAQ